MAALGVWRDWERSAAACGSYDHRKRREVHFLWPEGNLAEALLENQIKETDGAVAPDGGQAGDIRDRMLVSDGSTSADDLEPRMKRAVEEAKTVPYSARVVDTNFRLRPEIDTKSISSGNPVPVPIGSSAP